MSDDRSSAFASAELASELRDDPSGGARSFAGLVDDPEALRLLNYYDSLLDDPIEKTPLGREIIANCSTTTLNDAVRHGNVSQMKTGTGLTGQDDEDGADLLSRAADQLSFEGSIGLVFGAPGAGKTATTLDVAMTWKARTGGSLIGNTSWDGYDRVVKSDEEMVEAMASIEGPVLAVLDEIAQELSGFGSGNKAAEQFSNGLLFIRKKEEEHGPRPKKGSVLMVGHTRTKTAKSIRRVASFAIEKPSRSKPDRARLLESEGGKDEWEEGQTFQGLTDTAANYPEHEASEFGIVLDDDGDDDEGPDAEDIQRNQQIATVLRAVVKQGMSKKDAADLVDFSRHWVGERVSEYEKGEYQGLIDAGGDQERAG